jgi:hypothetical protein
MDWPLLFIIGNSNVKMKFAVVTLKCLRLIKCAIVAHELQIATCIVMCNYMFSCLSKFNNCFPYVLCAFSLLTSKLLNYSCLQTSNPVFWIFYEFTQCSKCLLLFVIFLLFLSQFFVEPTMVSIDKPLRME